ncbi:MAG: thioredoxin domain-containing protein [Gammaproteobacteria bacterium]|nr:thioredoxin domain-containing protein [Gammaproteobacteria bacterium]
MTHKHNQLAKETSPYLLQHADNPVHWYPWGEQALQLAIELDKPILLSIGYSACHWCHVMAHESFEDDATAQQMNDHFINIKVDREERPDLDKIYQLAHQLLTGRGGGWPLTLFLMPHDQTPFFAGTYFPPRPRHGLRSFSDILAAVHAAYIERRDQIQQQNQSLLSQLESLSFPLAQYTELNALPFELLSRQLLAQYDARYGGFGPRPKFPHPYTLERCLRQASLYGSNTHAETLQAGLQTARQMARGGLFDHIGGGFCRYSTDDQWMIPHFEKMLYDNAQLLALYVWAQQLAPDYYFACAIRQSADWVMTEMQAPAGGYYSAQDADSEGEEGKYYVWNGEQTTALLDQDQAELFNHSYGLDRAANFEGQWYPHTFVDIAQLAERLDRSAADIQQQLDRAKNTLYQQRIKRIHPGTDDKILTAWNALMIRAMNLAARTLQQPAYAASAHKALAYLRQCHWVDQRLLATSKDGKAHLNAYLDDYAYLLQAVIDALQNKWDNELFDWSKQIADCMLDLFEDKDRGGFYFTSSDHEQLIMRSKSFTDDAMPSGNGVAASALQTLGLLCGDTRYLESAEKTLQAAAPDIQQHPVYYSALLNALDTYLHPATIIILRGEIEAMQDWQQQVFRHYLPDVMCFAIPGDTRIPPELAVKKAHTETVCAYICEGMSCREALTELADFKAYIAARLTPLKDG